MGEKENFNAREREKGLTEGRNRERAMAKERMKCLVEGRKSKMMAKERERPSKEGRGHVHPLGHPIIERKKRE